MFEGIVYVDYTDSINSERLKLLHSFTEADHLVVINNLTCQVKFQGKCYYCTNQLFEFGAYQQGFDLLYKRGINSILFINNTIFDNPIFAYHLDFISNLAEVEIKGDNVVIGDRRQCQYAPEDSFVVSNIFLVKNCRREIKFVDDVTQMVMMSNSACSQKYQQLTGIYNQTFVQHFKSWMLPRKIWKGWYKLNYFEPPSDDLLLRKLFAIYCEHNFLKHNNLIGLNIIQTRKGRFLKLCYRLVLNFCKIKIRVLAGFNLKRK